MTSILPSVYSCGYAQAKDIIIVHKGKTDSISPSANRDTKVHDEPMLHVLGDCRITVFTSSFEDESLSCVHIHPDPNQYNEMTSTRLGCKTQ